MTTELDSIDWGTDFREETAPTRGPSVTTARLRRTMEGTRCP
ncbi:hypothetical protein [Halorussus ruber]|nr:hypothetical protein [Halorussus ruber]